MVGVPQGRPRPVPPQRVPGGKSERRPGARRRREALASPGDHDPDDRAALGAHPRHPAAAARRLAVPQGAQPAARPQPPHRDRPVARRGRAGRVARPVRERPRPGRRRSRTTGLRRHPPGGCPTAPAMAARSEGLRRRAAHARAAPERAGENNRPGLLAVRSRRGRPRRRRDVGGACHVPATGAHPHLSGHALQPARPGRCRALRAVGGPPRLSAHPGRPGRRSRPGRRENPAPAEAGLRLHPEEHPVRRGEPGEPQAARGPRRYDARHHLHHPAHPRAPGLVGESPALHGLDGLGHYPVRAPPGPGVRPRAHHRAPALPAVPAPGTEPQIPQRPDAQAKPPHPGAVGGAPAAALRRLHRQRHAGAALYQRARRGGHLRLLRPPAAAHHRDRHVPVRRSFIPTRAARRSPSTSSTARCRTPS